MADSWPSSFCWGAFGAILPEILRLKKIIDAGGAVPDFSWPFLIISLIYIVAAGIFAVAWKPENPFKAIWVGISFPILVSTLLQAAPTISAK